LLPRNELPKTSSGKRQRRKTAIAMAKGEIRALHTSTQLQAEQPTGPEAPTSPDTPLEALVARAWCRVLGVSEVHLDDDFYELGGDSARAMAVLSELEQALGRNLSPDQFIQTITVREQAALLAGRSTDGGGVVALQPHGSLPPLFILPQLSGTTGRIQTIANALKGVRRVVGLNAMTLMEDTPPQRRMGRLAAHYADRIMAIQGSGPVLVGGHSFGGLLAFATAAELERRGREVALVVVIDSPPPITGGRRIRAYHLLRFRRMQLKVGVWRRLDRLRGTLDPRLDRSRMVKDAFLEASVHYRPKMRQGRLLLLRVRHLQWSPDEWRMLAPRTEEHVVGGDHMSCLREPHAKEIAGRIRRAVDAALAGRDPSPPNTPDT
ncbi:MAG: alpha/beta fold hydrolase, partial [Alphaproteobacteria bacterium]|nr:alpha/beta fold hydrolase [Alphaproteobacteria bacterium]